MRLPGQSPVFLACSVVLLGAALSAPAVGEWGPSAPGPTFKKPKATCRPKSNSTTSRKETRRARAARRASFNAKPAKPPTLSGARQLGSRGPGGRTSEPVRRRETSLSGLKNRRQSWDTYTSRSVRSVTSGARPSSGPSQINALRARSSSAPREDRVRPATGRVQSGQRPLRRQTQGALPHMLQAYPRSFKPGDLSFKKTTERIEAIRYLSSESSTKGRWVTPAGLLPAAQAKDKLSLPFHPTAFAKVTIPKDTWIASGQAAPLFGHRGGGQQIFIDNPSKVSFGPRKPLGGASQ